MASVVSITCIDLAKLNVLSSQALTSRKQGRSCIQSLPASREDRAFSHSPQAGKIVHSVTSRKQGRSCIQSLPASREDRAFIHFPQSRKIVHSVTSRKQGRSCMFVNSHKQGKSCIQSFPAIKEDRACSSIPTSREGMHLVTSRKQGRSCMFVNSHKQGKSCIQSFPAIKKDRARSSIPTSREVVSDKTLPLFSIRQDELYHLIQTVIDCPVKLLRRVTGKDQHESESGLSILLRFKPNLLSDEVSIFSFNLRLASQLGLYTLHYIMYTGTALILLGRGYIAPMAGPGTVTVAGFVSSLPEASSVSPPASPEPAPFSTVQYEPPFPVNASDLDFPLSLSPPSPPPPGGPGGIIPGVLHCPHVWVFEIFTRRKNRNAVYFQGDALRYQSD
ncbi:hypothetical protein MAR_004758 [Mya arenaria]|uniref:Uncharacterized protein n=1 Tax=Mya arenaria TaxID=6604 RepID=A0ABY7EXH8_MYAAR|nr:hypothetical protein MAR_004758 [Mya arenaria]